MLARRDAHNIERLGKQLRDDRLLLVPHLDEDVHDIEGLARLDRYLFATEAQRRKLLDEVVA